MEKPVNLTSFVTVLVKISEPNYILKSYFRIIVYTVYSYAVKVSQLFLDDKGLVWPQPAIVDSESTIGGVHTQPANSQLITQSSMKYLGLARSA